MSTPEPRRDLPPNPSLTNLKKQAKELKSRVEADEAEAIERVRASHPNGAEVDLTGFTLRDAQATLAREYGFDGWQQLSVHVGEQMVDQRDLHRWFGTQLNNEMWSAIEDDSLGPATPIMERERLLYSAYASAYHWRTVGDEANFARGEHLISRMAARLGEGELALHHARRCLQIVESHPDVMADWDAAFANEALARAHAALGNIETARSHIDTARTLTEAVVDDADRSVLETELDRGPWFGLRD